MGDELLISLRALFGMGVDDLSAVQMSARAAIIFIAALVLVRFGDQRFLGKNTAFDVIVGFTLGSVLSRAINGSAALLPTVAASFVLVAMHYLFATLAFRFSRFGAWIKGAPHTLIKNGQIQMRAMGVAHISEHDLLQAVRLNTNLTELEQVQQAILERNGNISVTQGQGEPKVVTVSVAEGVQTIRIQIG